MGRLGAGSKIASLAAFAAAFAALGAPLAAPAFAQAGEQASKKPAVAHSADAAKLILAGDLDGFLGEVRVAQAEGHTVSGSVVLAVDALSKGDPAGAATMIDALPRRGKQSVSDLVQMWILLQQGDSKAALYRSRAALARLSAGLGGLAPALILESSGDLNGAAAAYASYLAKADTGPLPQGDPRDAAGLQRILESPRVAQAIYRAALVNHRLGKRDEALKYYLLSEQFAPGAPDVADNIARLKAGAPPREPALDARSGLGRWMMFVSIEYQIARAKAGGLDVDDSKPSATVSAVLEKYSGPVFAELGLRLDPSADAWRVAAADELVASGGIAGAEKLLAGLAPDSPFTAEGKLSLARIALTKKADAAAVGLVRQALAAGKGRWAIELDGGRALSLAGQDADAIAALDAAVASAPDGAGRAEALLARAGAKFQAGQVAQAGQDARAAVAADDTASVQLGAIGYLSMTEDGWYEAIRVGREALFIRPRSIDAMNALGYALIQREQGLDEGFKLLSRGVVQQPDYYPIIDSLGWAYYQYGDYESARELVAQANDLTKEDPNPEILDHLGDIYWRMSKASDARKTWTKALAARPDGARKQDLEKKIKIGLTAAAPPKHAPPRVDLRPFQGDGDQGPI